MKDLNAWMNFYEAELKLYADIAGEVPQEILTHCLRQYNADLAFSDSDCELTFKDPTDRMFFMLKYNGETI